MGVYIHVCVFYVHMVFDDVLLLMPATRKASLSGSPQAVLLNVFEIFLYM